jgi:hypothetical protein
MYPLKSITAALPWDHLQMDIITSFPSADGWSYILVLVDVFTGYVVLRPLQTKTTAEITRTLRDVFSHLGIPKIVQSDNDGSFLATAFSEFLDSQGITQMGVTSYQHRELGIAESMVKIASSTIRKQVAILGLRWPDLLPQVTLQIIIIIIEYRNALVLPHLC